MAALLAYIGDNARLVRQLRETLKLTEAAWRTLAEAVALSVPVDNRVRRFRVSREATGAFVDVLFPAYEGRVPLSSPLGLYTPTSTIDLTPKCVRPARPCRQHT